MNVYPSSPAATNERMDPFMGRMFLVVVDAFSKWIEVESLSSCTSAITVTRLRKIFALHGLPQVIVSDNGPAFIGPEIKEFFQKNGVRHLYTAPYHPASNGQAERMVQTFKESMKKLQHGDIETKLSRLLFGYRTTQSSVTGKTPAELLFNRQLRSTCHLLRPSMHSRIKKYQEGMEKQSNRRVNLRDFQSGDLIWVRNFSKGKKWLPGTVVSKLGAVDYDVVLEGIRLSSHRHIDQLLKRLAEQVCDTEGVDVAPVRTPEIELSEDVSRRNEVETEQAEFCVEVGEGNCGKDEEDEAEVTERRCSGRSIRKPQRLIEEDVNK